jgi:hypothetical protein
MKHILSVLLFSLLWAAGLSAAQYHVATNGVSSNAGTALAPWDLPSALTNASGLIGPGDTLYIHGGMYPAAITWQGGSGQMRSTLVGTSNQPVIVRPCGNDRVTIYSDTNQVGTHLSTSILAAYGAWTRYYNLETECSFTNRTISRPDGIDVYGTGIKVINCISHDCGIGITAWDNATNSEIYGCVIYNNGWVELPLGNGHGHMIYSQNLDGTRLLRDNIGFNQFGYGLDIYTEGATINNTVMDGNVIFNNGILQVNGTPNANILINAGSVGSTNIIVTANMAYDSVAAANITIGATMRGVSGILIESNYMGGGSFYCEMNTNVTCLYNTFATVGNTYNSAMTPTNIPAYTWNSNRWYIPSGGSMAYQGAVLTWNQWTNRTGYDLNSDPHEGTMFPTNVQVFVRANAYESNRANIVVFNWATNDNVSVDVSGVLSLGTAYNVRNAANYFEEPVISGVYSGGTISLPMTNLSVVLPIGIPFTIPKPTGPQFNVFVLLPKPNPLLAPSGLRVITNSFAKLPAS